MKAIGHERLEQHIQQALKAKVIKTLLIITISQISHQQYQPKGSKKEGRIKNSKNVIIA